MTDNSLLQDFIVETGDHLADTERNLLRLEQQPDDAAVLNDIFRSIHTIKGSSEYLGLERVAELSHKLENLLDLLRRGKRPLDAVVVDILMSANDRIVQLVDDLAGHQQEQTDIDDLVRLLDICCGEVTPVSAETAAGDSPQGSGDVIEDEYDEELFGIFLDQLESGLRGICEDTARLNVGAGAGKILARYQDRLDRLRSSANYMGYDKLKRVYVQWIQEVDQATRRSADGDALDWRAFAQEVTARNIERIRQFFPKVESLQHIQVDCDHPKAGTTAPSDDFAPEEESEELRFDDIGMTLDDEPVVTDNSGQKDSAEPALFRENKDPAVGIPEKADHSLIQDFIVESGEHIADTERNLLRLEQQPDDAAILNDIFRSIHTIKGSSEYLGLERIAELSHKLENLLDLLRRGERQLDGAAVDVLIGANDCIAQLVDDLARSQQEKTDIEDLVQQIDICCGHLEPVSAEEAAAETSSQGDDPAEGEYDEELFGIFLDQLESGLQRVCEFSRKLNSGEDAGKILAGYEDQLNTLKSSANYMGYDKLKDIYTQWSQAVAETVERLNGDKTVDWQVFSSEITGHYCERVKKFFSKVDAIQQLRLQLDAPAVSPGNEDGGDAPAPENVESPAANTEIDSELLVDFITESSEHLEEFEDNLLRLEQHPDESDIFNHLFRSVHTIKGSAEYLGMEHIAELSHRLENLLDILRRRGHATDGATIDVLIAAKDRLGQLVDDLVQHKVEQTAVEDLLHRIDLYCHAGVPEEPVSASEFKEEPPATAGIVYEEQYDQELFGVFSRQLHQGLSVLEQEMREAKSGKDVTAVIDICEAQLQKLRSSANYMEYFDLKKLYERWLTDLDALRRQAVGGETIDWDDWSDRTVPGYIAQIHEFFNFTDSFDSPPDFRAPEVRREPANPQDGFDLPVENSADHPNPEAENEVVGDAGPASGDEQSLLERLEKAFDAKMTVVAGTGTDFDSDVVNELLSDESIPESPAEAAAMAARLFSGHHPAGGHKHDNEIESFLFSDPDGRMAPRRPLTPKPLSQFAGHQDTIMPTPDLEKTDERRGHFTMGRRQTDKFRDRLLKQSIRVDAAKIDTLLNQVGELVVTRAGFSQLFSEMREFQLMLKQTQKLDGKENQAIKELTNRINAATVSLSRITSELQENVMKVRMLPIAQLFSRYPRVVHDLVRNTHKQVELEIHGEETELDRMVIEQISDPLVHIIRNAVDHGIEPVQERQRKGKPETGTLRLEAYHEGNYVVIEISDDGRGIDAEAIKSRALAKGYAEPDELESMSEEEITALIMRPGFSTADEVTHTSGRGVGMDVVKDNIDKLNGVISIESTADRGTLFRIKIPLTLAIIQALMVRVGREIFTIPLAVVDETIRIRREEISTIEGLEVYYLREHALPLIRLSDVFKMNADPDARDVFVVVVNTGSRQVGLIVDQLKGREEVVIKPLEDYLQEKSGFSGATILGDGSISLILDVADLVQLAVNQHVKKIRNGAETVG